MFANMVKKKRYDHSLVLLKKWGMNVVTLRMVLGHSRENLW